MPAEGGVRERVEDLVVHLPDRGREGGPEGVRREASAELAGRSVRAAQRKSSVALDPADAVHHRGRAAHVAPGDEVGDAGAPEPLRHVGGGRTRARPTTAGVGAAALEALDAIDIVYCQTWQYDDAAGRLANDSGARRGAATTPASAARPRRCWCRRRRQRIARGRARPRARLGRGGPRDAARVQEARRALPVLVQARGEAAVPVGGAVRPGRGRARGVPGVADVRDLRQRPARRISASTSTSTAARSARCWRR